MAVKRLLPRLLPDRTTNEAVAELRDEVHSIRDDLPDWQEITVTFTGAVTVGAQHSLGRRATRYIVVRSTAPCSVSDGADGTGMYPKDKIFLASTAAATVTLLVY